MLRHDFKRIIYSYGFYIAVALFVVTGILQQLSYTDGKARMLQTFGVTDFGFLNRYIASTCGDISATQLPFLLPVICAIPCANFYLQEYKSRYLRNVLIRTGRVKYFFSKVFTSFVAGMTVVLCGELILFILCFFIDPTSSIPLFQLDMLSDDNFLKTLYQENIPLFSLFESANLILFGGVYSLLTVSFSALWNNKYLAYSTGFLFANIVIDEIHRYIMTPWVTSCVCVWALETYQNTYFDVLIQYAALILISLGVYALFFFRRSKTDV